MCRGNACGLKSPNATFDVLIAIGSLLRSDTKRRPDLLGRRRKLVVVAFRDLLHPTQFANNGPVEQVTPRHAQLGSAYFGTTHPADKALGFSRYLSELHDTASGKAAAPTKATHSVEEVSSILHQSRQQSHMMGGPHA
jgi:hypothetical protein